MDSIYTFNGKKVGYFVLQGFVEKTAQELEALFQEFKSEGVNELICDLRYNGGGLVRVHNYGQFTLQGK
jgi:C-terminal processing protease CtpA/Prc